MGLFNANSTLASVVQDIIIFINLLVGVLSALAVVIFFWGLVRYVYKSDDTSSHAEARTSIMWSLIALFVLFSIWGILQLLNLTFFGGTTYDGSVYQPTSSYGTGGAASP